jgi:hypothetical protein
MCTHFLLCAHNPNPFPHYLPPRTGMFFPFPPVLWFHRRKKSEKVKRKIWHFRLSKTKVATQGDFCAISMYICFVSTIGWSLLIFFILHQSFSYGGFSRFKISVFIKYTEYTNHIQVLSFLTPPVHDLPLVWPMFHNIAAFLWGLYFTYERQHMASFGLLIMVTIISDDVLQFQQFTCKWQNFIVLCHWAKFHCISLAFS